MKAFFAASSLVAALAAAHVSAARPPAVEQLQAPTSDADTGFLDVSSDPPAKVLVDDADTGKTTPATHLPLKAGHHKLTLVTADGAHKRTIGFTIDAGQTTKLSVHLSS
jgi:PEGA domain